MAARWHRLKLAGRLARPHKAAIAPDFFSSAVLTNSVWDYVNLLLRQMPDGDRRREAVAFWKQSRELYLASATLSNIAKPLTLYYSFLNAAKCLLVVKNVAHSDSHGVGRGDSGASVALGSEKLLFTARGIFGALSAYMGDPATAEDVSLRAALANIPWIHRAFTLTYKCGDLYIPIDDPHFTYPEGTQNVRVVFRIYKRYRRLATKRTLPQGWRIPRREVDHGVLIERNRYVQLSLCGEHERLSEDDTLKLVHYHKRIRRDLDFIMGPNTLWYLKKRTHSLRLDRSSLVLAFASMHKLSELARYEPARLRKHFDAKHNWLLSEFLALAPNQFFDQIASEITGHQFMVTGFDARPR